MNDLSFLRAPYMQNYPIVFMVEVSSISKKNSSLEENLSWKDIQGLSWILEESSLELNEKFSTNACA